MKFLTVLIFFMGLLSSALSQESESRPKFMDEPYSARQSFGVFGAGGLNFHLADFQNLPNTPSCCPGFSTGTGFGFNFGLFYSLPLTNDLDLNIRGVYYDFSAKLTNTEDVYTNVVDANFNPTTGEFEHSINAKISTVGIEPMLQYKLTNQLRISAGFRFTYLINGTWDQKEELLNPSNGAFFDPTTGQVTRIRNEYSGGMDEDGWSQLDLGLSLAASYDLPLNSDKTVFLVPEAKYSIGFLSYISDQTWIPSQLSGGLGIRYAPRKLTPPPPPKKAPPLPPPPPPVAPPPPPPAEPELDAQILAYTVTDEGMETPLSQFVVEEFFQTRIHPLLPYVFFDHNSATIPSRYSRITQEMKDDYSLKQFFSKTTMDVYHDILNIIGKRMKSYPQSVITLTGTNSGKDEEKNNIDLSENRAQSIKNYLVNTWGVRPEQIVIESRNLPGIASNINSPDGIEENRRVEFKANMKYIFEPLTIRDTLREVNLPHLRFKPQIKSEVGISSWEILTFQGGRKLRTFKGKSNIPTSLDWVLSGEDEQKYIPNMNEDLEYKLRITDNDGKIWESEVQVMPVRVTKLIDKIFEGTDDKEIDLFNIIGFSYMSDKLSDENKNIADDAVIRIRDESSIDITGHSDRLGNDDFNARLSTRRANSTADYMKIDKKFAKGVGESILLYNNNLPEGRFYSRTVKIKIETPIEE